MAGHRGRPPEIARRPPGQGAPIGSRVADMQPTSRAIVQAAYTLLVRDGIRSVTLAGVAREAHVDVTTVSYHFRTRDGLIEALMDSLYAEPVADLVDEADDLESLPATWHAYLLAVRRMWKAQEADPDIAPDTRAYFDIAAFALRREPLRQRLAALQSWKVDAFLATLASENVSDVKALGEFIFAAVDGIELHQAIGGETFPLDDVMDLLERLVRPLIE